MSTVPRISPRWVPGYIGPRLARMLSRLAPFSARDTNTPCGLSAYLHRDASLMMLADLTIVLAKGEQTRLQVPFESCSEGMQRNLGPLIAPWTGRLVGLRQPWNRLHDDLGRRRRAPSYSWRHDSRLALSISGPSGMAPCPGRT